MGRQAVVRAKPASQALLLSLCGGLGLGTRAGAGGDPCPPPGWPSALTARPFLNRSSVRKLESILSTEAP